MNNGLFGSFRTKKFTDIYTNVESFMNDYKNNNKLYFINEIPPTISDDSAKTLYYLLYAEYGNSCIANFDENQFKYKLFSTIFMYGPSWEKKLDLQKKLRELTDDELFTGTKMIYNHAYNPGSTPSTGSLTELDYINEQNTNSTKKSKLDSYALLYSLIVNDVTKPFLTQFRKLFLIVVEPQKPLWYVENDENNE